MLPTATARRASPSSVHDRSGRVRAGVLALALSCALIAALTPPAQAALVTTGPINPGTHFPNYYTDQTGSSLQLCITGTAVCPALPPGGLVPPNGEAFYFLATAEIPVPAGVVSVTFALEAAFLSADGNSQLVFDRLRVRGPAPAGSYTLEHPYGETTLTSSGNLPTGINFTDDVGCADVPCNFDTAKGGRLTDFLRATGLVTPGFLGDSATRSTVTGATATDGGVPRNLVRLRNSSGVVLGQTNLFIVTGQLVNGPAAGLAESQVEFGNTAAADRSIAITNIGTAALSLGVPSVGGPYSVTAQTCSAGPIAIGATCSVTVHYASAGANANAAATLVMPANTTAGTVSIPLHATSLPVATVTGGPLEFGRVGLRNVSGARSVTLTNTGVVPMSVGNASAAGPFRASDTCGALLTPGASCRAAAAYTPTALGSQSGALVIPHPGASGDATTVALHGTGALLPPRAPSSVSPTPRNAAVRLRWHPPANGGRTISSYDVFTISSRGTVTRQRVDGAVTSMVVSHLRNGSPYRFQVRANNSIGNGPRSARSVAVRPGTPLAPRIGPAVGGKAGGRFSATARWRAPRANGTASITGYRVTARPLGSARSVTRVVPASARALNVTGLVRNAAYQFTVTAVNANGRSAGSARSNQVVAR